MLNLSESVAKVLGEAIGRGIVQALEEKGYMKEVKNVASAFTGRSRERNSPGPKDRAKSTAGCNGTES